MSLKTSPPHCRSAFFSLLFFFFHFSFLATYCSGSDNPQYVNCSSRFVCGGTVNVTYPFWGEGRPSYCGVEGFELGCNNNVSAFLDFEGQRYSVLHIDEEDLKMTIYRTDLSYNVCSHSFQNTTILSHTNHFYQTSLVKNLNIFYGCLDPTSMPMRNKFFCPYDGDDGRNACFFVEDAFLREKQEEITRCNFSIKVPVLRSAIDDIEEEKLDLQGALNTGFEMKYNVSGSCIGCELSGGMCGTKPSLPDFVCYCRDKPHQLHCPTGGMNLKKKFLIAGTSVAATAIVGILVVMFVFLKYRKRRQPKHPYIVTRNISSSYSSSRTGLATSEASYYGLPLFEYDELREATNNFDPGKELGDGGFGTVFYGKLRDGRAVAVKRLYENNYKRTAQFMNEVEILARLHHPNLVHLYGCTSRQSHRLLLVYEYVPNGTVADHLHGDLAKDGSLPWLVRMNIAVETASALVYLHASDIVHRDVKTNNILLDENFKVKVADFGLSRLFPLNVTHVSTAPQGTPGYVDPEYHQCYQLTDKSDVYSFGVVLMELISSLPAVDIMRHRHEINLSTMAMNKIQSDALHELVDTHLGFDSDSNTRRMIEAVAELGFRCLQHGKDMRPSMAEVLNALEDILKQDSKTDIVQEDDTPSDDVSLLKVDPLMLSPDSVMVKWSSMNPTPNTST